MTVYLVNAYESDPDSNALDLSIKREINIEHSISIIDRVIPVFYISMALSALSTFLLIILGSAGNIVGIPALILSIFILCTLFLEKYKKNKKIELDLEHITQKLIRTKTQAKMRDFR